MKKTIFVAIFVSSILLIVAVGAGVFFLNQQIASSDGGIFKSLGPAFQVGIHLGLGENLFEAHQYEAAEQEFRKAYAAAAKDKDETNMGETLTRVAQCLLKQSKEEEALKVLKEASEHYESAGYMLTVEKRVRVKCLTLYVNLLKKRGDKVTVAKLSETLDHLRKQMGPAEPLRNFLTEL